MRVCAIAQARMGSTRFHGKVMKYLGGKPVLRWTWDALYETPGVETAVIATSTLPADDIIEEYCYAESIQCFRGSESDVLDRFYRCAKHYSADIILRITCDCPFIDPYVTGQVIQLLKSTGASYASNQPTWPDGLDVECFTFAALEAAWREATRSTDRDTVTQWIIRNQDRFPAEYLTCPFPGAHKERWVLDTEKDWNLCECVATRWTNGRPPTYLDILGILDKEPEIRNLNKGAIRNERFYEGLAVEELPRRDFSSSQEHLGRASIRIPIGSQTFSKSHLFYPEGGSPLFVSHGDGARVFDVDGQDYIDLVGALLPVVLGYRDPDVDDAVRRQLNRAGMSFSLATKLEFELAELLCQIIPCAEMVRFGKTGTDVTSAAVRLARAAKQCDHILVGGYHGWADWSIAGDGDKNLGVPFPTKKVSHKFQYGDTKQVQWFLDSMRGMIAAIIVEPTENRSYLRWLREVCDRNDIVLIFDEIQTGFRYDLGGAQSWFGVTPDLACFGKAMGNGMPISALVGKKELMKLFEPPDSVFFSGTFFGDTLSIVAAIATIEKMRAEDVVGHLWRTGVEIKEDLRFSENISENFEIYGPACLTKIRFKDHPNVTKEQAQALFTQEMAQRGVLILNAHGLSYAHKEPEVTRICNAYEHTFAIMNECLAKQGEIDKVLKGTIKGIGVRH